MASFMEDLWNSIFTPGPTPALLVATNASFAALQLLLFILLVATHSVHFVVLSFLSGGLWYSINWFARELQAAEKAKAKSESGSGGAGRSKKDKSPEPGSDTETETLPRGSATSATSSKKRQQARSAGTDEVPAHTTATETATEKVPASSVESTTLLQPSLGVSDSDDALRRRKSLGDSSGYVSTDSEWEKVSEGESKGM